MSKRTNVILVLLIVISCLTYFRIIYNGNIRGVEFLAILAIGILTGALLTNLLKPISAK
jgi:hypothetical protein